MPIRKHTVAEALVHQEGDGYAHVGDTIQQIRSGLVIATQPIVATEILASSDHVGQNSTLYFYEGFPMPVSKTVTGTSIGPSGVVRINFSDGNQRELAGGHAEGVDIADALDADGDYAERILIAKAYRHSPDGTGLNDIIGSTVTIDSSADVPIQFTPSNELQ